MPGLDAETDRLAHIDAQADAAEQVRAAAQRPPGGAVLGVLRGQAHIEPDPGGRVPCEERLDALRVHLAPVHDPERVEVEVDQVLEAVREQGDAAAGRTVGRPHLEAKVRAGIRLRLEVRVAADRPGCRQGVQARQLERLARRRPHRPGTALGRVAQADPRAELVALALEEVRPAADFRDETAAAPPPLPEDAGPIPFDQVVALKRTAEEGRQQEQAPVPPLLRQALDAEAELVGRVAGRRESARPGEAQGR